MFRALARVFARPDRLTALSRQADRAVFVHCLLNSDVIVLAALQSEGLDAATFTQKQLLAEIERSARDLSERQEFEPFVYGAPDGAKRLPFFSTERHAQAFCGEYS